MRKQDVAFSTRLNLFINDKKGPEKEKLDSLLRILTANLLCFALNFGSKTVEIR